MVKLVYISSPYILVYLFLCGEHMKSTLLIFILFPIHQGYSGSPA